MMDEDARYRVIRVGLIQHKGSDLMLAISDDLPGLMIPIRSVDELAQKMPHAIRELLEAQGNRVGEVLTFEEGGPLPEQFVNTRFSAKAEVYCD
jgi:hypothetical protein